MTGYIPVNSPNVDEFMKTSLVILCVPKIESRRLDRIAGQIVSSTGSRHAVHCSVSLDC